MKVVINRCYGGFSLSPRAIKRMAELDGRQCYFFTSEGINFDKRIPVTLEELEAKDALFFSAFDVPNPDEVLPSQKNWSELSMEERGKSNEEWEKHTLRERDIPRNDPKLIQVVEELGGEHRKGASGRCAELVIVEIPDDVEWEIEEYDGNEWIAEKHRTWR